MSSRSALARIVAALDGSGIPHRVAGSFASTFHGEPRTTHDIQLVIDLRGDARDRAHVEHRARELGVGQLWDRAQSHART